MWSLLCHEFFIVYTSAFCTSRSSDCLNPVVSFKSELYIRNTLVSFFICLYFDAVQTELYSRLIQLRNSLASQLGLHTYMIFSNKSLLDMSQCRFGKTAHFSAVSMMAVHRLSSIYVLHNLFY